MRLSRLKQLICCTTILLSLICYTPASAEQAVPALISAKDYDWMRSYVLAYGLRAKIMANGNVMYYKRYLVGVKSPPGDEQRYLLRVQFSYLPVSPGSGVNISLHYEREIAKGVKEKIEIFMDDADMDGYPNSIIKVYFVANDSILMAGGKAESMSVDWPMWNYWLNYLHERFRNEEARRRD